MTWSSVLDQLVRERGAALFGYAYVLTGSRADAEDLLHDALVRTFRRGRQARDLNSAHSYVKKAITTAFIDGHRRASVRPRRTDADIHDIPATALAAREDHAAPASGMADLQAALLDLPRRERACVVLRHLEDWPVARIAAELGIAEGSVKRYISDGLARLRTTRPDLNPIPDDGPETVSLVTRSGGTR